MKTFFKIIGWLLAVSFLINCIAEFTQDEIWSGIVFFILGIALVITLLYNNSPLASLKKAIKLFPKTDPKVMEKLQKSKASWVNDKLFKKTAIDGFDKVIDYKNVLDLGETFLDFYNLFFPNETESIQSKINKCKVEAFVHSRIAKNNGLDPKEINDIVLKSKELNVLEYDSVSKVEISFDNYIFQWKLANGILPNLEPDFLLQKGEQCIYKSYRCEVLERKEITKRVNYAGPKARIKIAKGLSYNIGSYNVSTQKETVSVSKGVGKLNLTTKRILFKSGDKGVTVTLSSIIDIEPFSDAVIITKSTGKPLIFNVSDGIRFYQLLDAAINSTQSSRNENKIESESEYEYDQELNQGSIDNELIEIISTKGLLNAVKFYKESENVSLREAKDYVDRLNEKIRK
jgi:hypothetical protein